MNKRIKTIAALCLAMSYPMTQVRAESITVETVEIVQQHGSCTGIVKDKNGTPLAGASVMVKGTTKGTIADNDGRFSLTGVKKGDTIHISYIGYKTVNVTWTENALNVVLEEDTNTFDEVVVTGYGGHQKRATLTTAVTKMDDRVLETAAFANVGQALQGSVTGLRVTNVTGSPGDSPDIQLRGIASLNSSANALIIVDGVVRNSMADLNSNDIESIQVLKDAASTSIYGARANGGVILIETKQGKEGHTEVNLLLQIRSELSEQGVRFP